MNDKTGNAAPLARHPNRSNMGDLFMATENPHGLASHINDLLAHIDTLTEKLQLWLYAYERAPRTTQDDLRQQADKNSRMLDAALELACELRIAQNELNT